MIGSPQNGLAKILVRTLAPVLDKFSKYSVEDSFQLTEKIKVIPPSKVKNSYMISHDIKSLFTNVPIIKVIEFCLNQGCHISSR